MPGKKLKTFAALRQLLYFAMTGRLSVDSLILNTWVVSHPPLGYG